MVRWILLSVFALKEIYRPIFDVISLQKLFKKCIKIDIKNVKYSCLQQAVIKINVVFFVSKCLHIGIAVGLSLLIGNLNRQKSKDLLIVIGSYKALTPISHRYNNLLIDDFLVSYP